MKKSEFPGETWIFQEDSNFFWKMPNKKSEFTYKSQNLFLKSLLMELDWIFAQGHCTDNSWC